MARRRYFTVPTELEEVADAVADHFEGQGYAVSVEPHQIEFPCRPSLVCRRENELVIVEIHNKVPVQRMAGWVNYARAQTDVRVVLGLLTLSDTPQNDVDQAMDLGVGLYVLESTGVAVMSPARDLSNDVHLPFLASMDPKVKQLLEPAYKYFHDFQWRTGYDKACAILTVAAREYLLQSWRSNRLSNIRDVDTGAVVKLSEQYIGTLSISALARTFRSIENQSYSDKFVGEALTRTIEDRLDDKELSVEDAPALMKSVCRRIWRIHGALQTMAESAEGLFVPVAGGPVSVGNVAPGTSEQMSVTPPSASSITGTYESHQGIKQVNGFDTDSDGSSDVMSATKIVALDISKDTLGASSEMGHAIRGDDLHPVGVRENGQEWTLKILHISDLHMTEHSLEDQKVMLRAFWSDLAILRDRGLSPDVICFTGDITYSGQATEYSLAAHHILDPLLQTTQLDKRRLLWIPGNHDVNRAEVARDNIGEAGARALFIDRNEVNRALDDPEKRRRLFQRLENYANFTREYFRDVADMDDPGYYTTRILTVRDKNFGFACLNSAWRCSGPGDEGHILIGDRQRQNAYDEVSTADIKIALVHHPFEWLHEHERREAETFCAQRFDLILRGHLHEPEVRYVVRPVGGVAEIPAGALFRGRKLEGYSLIELGRRPRVHLRRYIEQREAFDADVISAPDGRFEWEPKFSR